MARTLLDERLAIFLPRSPCSFSLGGPVTQKSARQLPCRVEFLGLKDSVRESTTDHQKIWIRFRNPKKPLGNAVSLHAFERR